MSDMHGCKRHFAAHAVLWIGLIAVCGCGDSKWQMNANREVAEKRWNTVRSDVKLSLAKARFKAGDMDAAMRELDEAGSLDPHNPACYVLLARIRLEQGKLAAARESVREALSRDGGDAESLYVAGVVAERYEDYPAALDYFERASNAMPRNSDYLAARAETLVAMGRTIDALDLVESRVESFDDDGRLRMIAAGIYATLGMHAQAADRYREAARAVGDDPSTTAALGISLARAGRNLEAVGILGSRVNRYLSGQAAPVTNDRGTNIEEKPVEECPPSLVWITLADCCHRLSRLDDARRFLTEHLSRQPNDGQAWLLLARVAIDDKDMITAREAAERASQCAPDKAATHLVKAYVLVQLREFDDARRAAVRATDLDRNDPTGWCLIGQCAGGRGDLQAARDAYVEALVRDPDCEVASRLLRGLTPSEHRDGPRRPGVRTAVVVPVNDWSTTEDVQP